MERTQRRTDAWLAILSVLLLIISPVENALGNDLPQILPAAVRDHAPLVFAALLALMGIFDLALLGIRHILSEDPVRARSRRLRRTNLILSVGVGVVGGLAGIVSPLVVPQMPAFTQVTNHTGPWLTVLLPLVLLALLIALPLLGDWLSAGPDQNIEDRAAFLRTVTRRYDHFLDDPLQRAVRAALDLRETSAALQRPEVTIEALPAGQFSATSESEPNSLPAIQTLQTISPGKTLLPIFDAAHGQLLMLGAPGAGKTTQLYALARELVKQAQQDAAARIPVILDLSTWAANKDPLEHWMADELAQSYEVRKDIAARWLHEQQLLPLLDAFDVMAEDDRPACIDAMNTYLATYPSGPLVVCSRRDEFQRIIGAALKLRSAATIQPLTDEAIDEALDDGGSRLATLRQLLARDTSLYAALRTPLILSLVVLTYGELRGEEIPHITDLAAWRRQLFRRYLDRVLEHQPGTEPQPVHYDEETFKRTLAWLGAQMRIHGMDTFYLERLQADWVSDVNARKGFDRFSWLVGGLDLMLFCGLVGGAIGALVGALGAMATASFVAGLLTGMVLRLVVRFALRMLVRAERFDDPRISFQRGTTVESMGLVILGVALAWNSGRVTGELSILLGWLAVGVIAMLVLGWIGKALVGRVDRLFGGEVVVERRFFGLFTSTRRIDRLVVTLIDGLPIGLLFGLIGGIFFGLVGGLLFGLASGLLFGLVIAPILEALGSLFTVHGARPRIKPVGSLRWFRREAMQGLGTGLGLGLLFALLLGLAGKLVLGLLFALGIGLIFGLGSGLRPVRVNEEDLYRANEGIRRSARFGLIGGLLLGLSFGLLFGLIGGPGIGLIFGLVGGLLFGLVIGGEAALLHFALRRALLRSGDVPSHLVRFLDEASRLVLLRRVGGGYQFIHQLLRDDFADQYVPPKDQ